MTLFTRALGPSDAPAIVFLHGGGVSGWMWNRQVDFFRDRYRLLAPDLPGHGQSRHTPFRSMQDAAEHVLQMIRREAPDHRIILVGLSLGAQLVVQLLSDHPDLAEAAVINSALVRPMGLAASLVKPLLAMSLPLVKNRSFAKLQAKQLYIGPELFEQYFADSQLISAADLTSITEANMSFALPEEFGRCHARVLTMVGEKEKGIMLQSGRDIRAATKGGAGVMVPGVGHGVSLADPDLFNGILEAWVEGRALPPGLKSI